jgi:prephenate dehydratase
VDAITSPHTPITSSYPVKISCWAKWFFVDFQHSIDLDCLGKLLKLIAENQENETIDWHPKVAVQR